MEIHVEDVRKLDAACSLKWDAKRPLWCQRQGGRREWDSKVGRGGKVALPGTHLASAKRGRSTALSQTALTSASTTSLQLHRTLAWPSSKSPCPRTPSPSPFPPLPSTFESPFRLREETVRWGAPSLSFLLFEPQTLPAASTPIPRGA